MKKKKSIISWTVTKWFKGRGLLFREERWILKTTHTTSPATAERYPWFRVPFKVPKFCSRKIFLDSGKKIWESQHSQSSHLLQVLSCSPGIALNVQSNCFNQREGALYHEPQGPAVYRVRQHTALAEKTKPKNKPQRLSVSQTSRTQTNSSQISSAGKR